MARNLKHFVGVICGLKSEAGVVARFADRSKIRVGVSGANAARAEKFATKFCEEGACAIVSVGVSGGLDPSLQPGDLIVGEDVVGDDGGIYECDRFLMGSIKRELDARGAIKGRLFGSDEIIDSVVRKEALFENHRAIAVDMESHGAARAAARNNTAFLAIRAIADPADRALPEAALNAIAEDGSMRTLATLTAAFRDTKQFPDLMKLGKDNAAAMDTLRRDLGPLFRALFLSLDL